MSFFEAAGAVLKISLSLQITNFNQVKLAQICETHCITVDAAYNDHFGANYKG